MKRKVYIIVAIAAVAVALTFNGVANSNTARVSALNISNVEALTMGENPECPNGCKACGDGCYCYDMYPWYREAN